MERKVRRWITGVPGLEEAPVHGPILIEEFDEADFRFRADEIDWLISTDRVLNFTGEEEPEE